MERSIKINYQVLQRSELSEEQLSLEAAALKAAEGAYAPYSHFHVGAAVLLDNGEIVTGSNQENAAYPSGICAERTALFWAASQWPEAAVECLAIVATNEAGRVPFISPCGACRQVILETATRYHPFPVLLCGEQEAFLLEDSRQLLPFGFDGSAL